MPSEPLEPRGQAKRLIEVEFDWIGGPLDGLHGIVPTRTITREGNDRIWMGPDPGSREQVVAYILNLHNKKAVYSSAKTREMNERMAAAKLKAIQEQNQKRKPDLP